MMKITSFAQNVINILIFFLCNVFAFLCFLHDYVGYNSQVAYLLFALTLLLVSLCFSVFISVRLRVCAGTYMCRLQRPTRSFVFFFKEKGTAQLANLKFIHLIPIKQC